MRLTFSFTRNDKPILMSSRVVQLHTIHCTITNLTFAEMYVLSTPHAIPSKNRFSFLERAPVPPREDGLRGLLEIFYSELYKNTHRWKRKVYSVLVYVCSKA